VSNDPAPSESALRGRTIAVAETRELEVFAALLERRGACVLRYPLVAIRDAPDPGPVLEWLRGFAGGSCDDLILLTGEGLRRLLACLRRHAPALEPAFRAALAAVRKITRGPKPARALRELGLASDLAADPPTTAGVIATLARHELGGRRVGVQLYGSEPNRELLRFLESAGARPVPVAPYVYADASDAARVRELLQRMRSGEVDAIAFTSKTQVERLSRRWRSRRWARSWPPRWRNTASMSARCRRAPGS
jgi:uroporphyrinogen-III synthase